MLGILYLYQWYLYKITSIFPISYEQEVAFIMVSLFYESRTGSKADLNPD